MRRESGGNLTALIWQSETELSSHSTPKLHYQNKSLLTASNIALLTPHMPTDGLLYLNVFQSFGTSRGARRNGKTQFIHIKLARKKTAKVNY